MKQIYFLIITLLSFSLGFGQDIVAISGVQSSQASTVANISANPLSRGSGISSTGTSTFNSTGWTTSTSSDPNDYIEWSVTADPGYTVTVTNIEIDYDRSGTGPSNVSIRTNLDGYTSDIFTDTSVNSSGEENSFVTSLTSIDGGTITFRLYAYNSSSGSGTFDIEDDLGTFLSQSATGILLSGTVDASATCTSPTTQSSGYNTTSIASTSATLNWTRGDGDNVLVLVKEGSAVDSDPSNGTSYTANSVFSSGDELGTGNYVVYNGSAATVDITGLSEITSYHVAVYEYNTTDTCYNLTAETGNFTTICSSPTDITGLTSSTGNLQIQLDWTNETCYDEILVLAKLGSAVTMSPSGDGTAYTANTIFGAGTDLGTGEYVVYKGTGTSVTVTGLINGTVYHFEVFARKGTSWSAGVTINDTPNIIEEAVAGDLLITEVSGDDAATGNDNGYMEIYNRSTKLINLSTIEARYYNTNPNNPSQTVALTGILAPGGFIIVTQNAANYLTEYGSAADFTGSDFFFNGGDDGCDVYHTTNGIIDQFNDNGTGQSPWTWSDNFAWKRNTTESGALQSSWTQNGTSTPNAKENLIFWTGTTSTAWEVGTNWDTNTVPTTTSDIIITDKTNKPIIATSIEIENCTLETSSELTINKNGNLTITNNLSNNSTLTLESDSDEFSSLIVSGSVTGSVTYERFAAQVGPVGSNDLIAAPLSGQAFSDFATANTGVLADNGGTLRAFAPFDKTSGSYTNYDTVTDAAVTLNAGTGYRAATNTGSNLTFSGTVNTGTVNVPISNSGPSYEAWNLIGNPFPSYLDVDSFISTNQTQMLSGSVGVYGYDGDASDGWIVYNLASSGVVMTPGQGFFVAATSGGGSVDFTPSMRITGSSDDFIVGRVDNSSNSAHAKLNLDYNSSTFGTDIYFIEGTTQSLDPGYDTSAFNNNAAGIFTALVQNSTNEELAIQSLPYSDLSDVVVPVGIKVNAGIQATIRLNDISTIPSSMFVYLEDTTENTWTLLNDNDYTFVSSTDLNGTGRFYIHFSAVVLSNEDFNFENIAIYTPNSNSIVVKGQLTENTTFTLYDIQGRLVLTKDLDSNLNTNTVYTPNISKGVYLVKLDNNNFSKTKKIIIR